MILEIWQNLACHANCRWLIRCLGMRRRPARAILTSQKCGTTCIATHCTAWTRKHRMHWGGLSRREGRMLGHGDRHATSLLWPLLPAKVGILMPFSMLIPVLPFGTCPPGFANFVMLSAMVLALPLLALFLPGLNIPSFWSLTDTPSLFACWKRE